MKITKYGNRKYFVSKLGYVTLTDIVKVVKEGNEIQVTCHKTRTDITNQTLLKCLEYKGNLQASEIYQFLRK